MTLSAPMRCSALAEQLGEPLAGTVDQRRRWLLLEDRSAWGTDAVAERFGADAAATAKRLGMRLLLVRRREGDPSDDTVRRAILVDTESAAMAVRTVRGPGDLDVEALAAMPLEDFGARMTDPILLVCTNGRRDACCALRGRALTVALADEHAERVWECTHLGGHRLSANLVCLPHGIVYGRVAPDDGPRLASAYLAGELDPELLRGRSALAGAGPGRRGGAPPAPRADRAGRPAPRLGVRGRRAGGGRAGGAERGGASARAPRRAARSATADQLPRRRRRVAAPLGRRRAVTEAALLVEAAARFGTPLYVTDLDDAASRAHAWREALPGALVAYAVKANPDPALLRRLAAEGIGFEVVGPVELALALRAGADPQRIVVNGVGQTDADLAAALATGALVNAESLGALDALLAAGDGRIGIRVNPGIAAETHPHLATGAADLEVRDRARRAARGPARPRRGGSHVDVRRGAHRFGHRRRRAVRPPGGAARRLFRAT